MSYEPETDEASNRDWEERVAAEIAKRRFADQWEYFTFMTGRVLIRMSAPVAKYGIWMAAPESATHLLVGRDHAGVADFYGPFDAQAISTDQLPEGALEIEIFSADHTAWSGKLNKFVMMREVDDHSREDYVFLSGTKVREMLRSGIAPPPKFFAAGGCADSNRALSVRQRCRQSEIRGLARRQATSSGD